MHAARPGSTGRCPTFTSVVAGEAGPFQRTVCGRGTRTIRAAPCRTGANLR